MAIEQPNVEQASGYSFAPKYQPKDVKGLDKTATQLGSTLSNFATKFLEKRDTEDNTQFLQGIVDETAGAVQEGSWSTPQSYSQGVAYKKLSDGNSAASARIYDIMSEEFKSGKPNFQSFNDKLKQEMGLLVDTLNQSGLEGSALELAQKQLIQTSTIAQQNFQKRLELQDKRNRNEARVQTTNTAFTDIRNLPEKTPQNIGTILTGLQQTLQVSYTDDTNEDPHSSASKLVVDSIKSELNALNPADATSQKYMAAMNQWIGSDDAVKVLGASYNDATDAVVKKQEEVMGYNGDALSVQITEMERRASTGEYIPSRLEFQAQYADIRNKVATKVLKAADGDKLYKQLFSAESKIYKDAVDNSLALSPDVTVRMGAFGTGYNSKAVEAWNKQVGANIPNDSQRGIAQINFGVNSKNPEMIKEGGKQFATALQSMLLADPVKFDERVTVEDKAAWTGLVNVYKTATQQNPAYAAAILDGLPEEQRTAFESMILAGNPYLGRNVAADMTQMRSIMKNRETTKAAGGFAGTFTRSSEANFTGDDLISAVFSSRLLPTVSFGLLGETSPIRAQNWWNQGNPESRDRVAALLNQARATAQPWLNAQEANGLLIQDKGQMIAAMVKGGYIIPTETNPVIMNPQLKTAAQQGFKAIAGVPMSDELLQRTMSVIQNDFYKKHSGKGGATSMSNFDVEDVIVQADGPILNVYAYKNGERLPIATQRWGVSHLHERAWNIMQADKKVAEATPQYVGEMVHGKRNMPISKEFSNIFKGASNDVLSSLFRFEGSTGSKVHTPDPKNRPNIKTVGMGIRVDGDFGKEPLRAAILKATTKQEFDLATNRFLADYYKGYPKLVQSAGLPPIDAANATGSRTAHIALANAHYQSPQAGQEYAALLQQAKTDPKGALDKIKGTSFYMDIQKTGGNADKNDRVRLYREGIQAAARAAGIEAYWMKQGKKMFFEPTYPLLTTPEGFKPTPPRTPEYNADLKRRSDRADKALDTAFRKPTYPVLGVKQ